MNCCQLVQFTAHFPGSSFVQSFSLTPQTLAVVLQGPTVIIYQSASSRDLEGVDEERLSKESICPFCINSSPHLVDSDIQRSRCRVGTGCPWTNQWEAKEQNFTGFSNHSSHGLLATCGHSPDPLSPNSLKQPSLRLASLWFLCKFLKYLFF